VDISSTYNFQSRAGAIALTGSVERVEQVLTNAASLGQVLNHGWILNGETSAALQWEWKDAAARGQWSGTAALSGGELLAAGLNLPLRLDELRLDWKDGKCNATIAKIAGFGANWSGEVKEAPLADAPPSPRWNFQLHADHLDAAELDKWTGPRARPSWLERLLPWLARDSVPGVMPTELLRRMDVQGELRVDELTVEKLKFSQVRATMAMHELQLNISDAEGQWAGGKVRASMSAKFSPLPEYQVAAELDGVNLGQVMVEELLNGVASGQVHLTTEGVGREELLQKLAGNGDIRLKKAEFRAWDVTASLAAGAVRPGVSRWSGGAGTFAVRDRNVFVLELRLNGAPEQTVVEGTVNFAKEADLRIRTMSAAKREKRAEAPERVLKVLGPLEGPRVSVEKPIPTPTSD